MTGNSPHTVYFFIYNKNKYKRVEMFTFYIFFLDRIMLKWTLF